MRFHQGKWFPKFPEKYQGDVNNIVYRSSWELKAFIWFDSNSSILKWASEELVIPYWSPADQRMRRYFPDFVIQYKTNTGTVDTAVVEVKPHAQCSLPKVPKRQTKRYLNEVVTYTTNQAKWQAARAWCADKGWKFVILTEYELGIAKRPKAK